MGMHSPFGLLTLKKSYIVQAGKGSNGSLNIEKQFPGRSDLPVPPIPHPDFLLNIYSVQSSLGRLKGWHSVIQPAVCSALRDLQGLTPDSGRPRALLQNHVVVTLSL